MKFNRLEVIIKNKWREEEKRSKGESDNPVS